METRERVETPEQDAESTPDLGATLRLAREAQDLSIEDVAAELRIGAHFLEALEDCRFEALGPPVFAKGYLKQYGTRLGLDVAALVADYENAAGDLSVDVAPSRSIKLHDARQITLWVVAGGVLVLVAVFLAFWWFNQSDRAPESAPATPKSAETVSQEPPPPAPERPAQAGNRAPPDSSPIDDAEAARPRASAADTDADGGLSLTQPTASGPDGAAPPIAEPSVVESPAAAPANAESSDAQSPDAGFDGPALEVEFVEDSWAEVTDANGVRLYYALGRAGTRRRFPADRHLHLLFGNAHGVELRLDGREIPLPGSGQPGEVVQFDLDALID